MPSAIFWKKVKTRLCGLRGQYRNQRGTDRYLLRKYNLQYLCPAVRLQKNHGYLPDSREEHWIELLDKAGYTVIPPSGTFRDLVKELDFIMGELGCRIIQLLPVHPTPTTYARMGRYGSPYAALSFTSVDPALAEFDPRATPLEQFVELVDAIHERHAKIFIDIAINHTGWASSLHGTHPEWLVRDPEGRIEVPGAWGVLWEDLTRLDYRHKGLWQYMANIYLTWCRRGVDGFRCDAGYMIPVPVWKYIVATVREQYPDTIFLLEGLGGKISVNRDILNTANFNWAYSELFKIMIGARLKTISPKPSKFLKVKESWSILRRRTTTSAWRLDQTPLPVCAPHCARCVLSMVLLVSPMGWNGTLPSESTSMIALL